MYYNYDGLGTVTDLTDRLGDTTAKYRFDAFGSMFAGVLAPYSTIGITGKEYDPKSGLVNFGARWYDPKVGRFTQADTFKGIAKSPITQHPYAYVGNNPINNIDPTGHAFLKYVPLYLDFAYAFDVELHTGGVTYFKGTSVRVRDHYQGLGYSVYWLNDAVWVFSPAPPPGGDNGGSTPPPEPTPEERRDEFNSNAGSVPGYAGTSKAPASNLADGIASYNNSLSQAAIDQSLVHKLIEISLGQGDQNVLYAAIKNSLVSVVELSGGRDYDYVGPWQYEAAGSKKKVDPSTDVLPSVKKFFDEIVAGESKIPFLKKFLNMMYYAKNAVKWRQQVVWEHIVAYWREHDRDTYETHLAAGTLEMAAMKTKTYTWFITKIAARAMEWGVKLVWQTRPKK